MPHPTRTTRLLAAAGLLLAACLGAGCANRSGASGGSQTTFNIGAIPDQDPQELQRRYSTLSDYLSSALGVPVRYVPVTDYTAAVTAFRHGDLDLAFFGGLTGVQARLQVPGAMSVAQRDIDERFRSVFIASAGSRLQHVSDVAGLREFAGHTFTFGSESSTSGRLMPQYYLSQAGIRLTDFKGQPGFSGSHDATVKLVEAGTYDAGALSAAVWDQRVKGGLVNLSKVHEVFRSAPYHDYHWLLRPDADQRFGAGFSQRVVHALLTIDGRTDQQRQILALFQAKRFIATKPENYHQIETVARNAGLIK
jgi:phosphonate transport system substrate-binding protein